MSPRTLIVLALVSFGLTALSGLWEPSARLFHPLLAVAVLASLTGRAGFAIGAGLFVGVLADAWSARWFGQHAFCFMTIAWFLSLIARRVDLAQPLPAVAALAFAAFAHWGLQVFLAALLGAETGALPGASSWLLAALVDTAWGALLYRVLRKRELL